MVNDTLFSINLFNMINFKKKTFIKLIIMENYVYNLMFMILFYPYRDI